VDLEVYDPSLERVKIWESQSIANLALLEVDEGDFPQWLKKARENYK
jgi:hypothetical protein